MRLPGAASVCFLLLGSAVIAAEPAAAPKIYPLAAKSLVLDVARADDALIAVGDRGFILRSTDGGTNWVQQASPAAAMLTGVRMLDATNGWAVGHDAVILKTADGGVTWTKAFEDPELEAPLFDIWFENAQHGIAVGAYGLIEETQDGGATWQDRRISEDEPHLYTIAPLPDGGLIAVGEMGGIFKSADKGATWNPLPSPYEGTFFGALVQKDGAILVYGLRGNLYRSEDGGNVWSQIETRTETSLLGATERADGGVVIVGLSGTVLSSRDGRTFTVASLPEREALGGAIEAAPGKLLVFGERGAYALPEPRR